MDVFGVFTLIGLLELLAGLVFIGTSILYLCEMVIESILREFLQREVNRCVDGETAKLDVFLSEDDLELASDNIQSVTISNHSTAFRPDI